MTETADNTRTLAEMVLKNALEQGKSHSDACKFTVDMLLPTHPQISRVLENMLAERDEQIRARFKLTEIDTSRHRDLIAQGWYQGSNGEAGIWGQLKQRMSKGSLADAVPKIDLSTDSIMASIAEPYVSRDRRLGLVIGNVQSGKTANFSAVIAKAMDSRYKFVIVLSGVHNNLRKQTQQRLEKDLGVGGNAEWYKLTGVDGDFGDQHTENATNIIARNDRILAVVKKNGTRLRNLLAFLRTLDEPTKRNTPILIVDDESDQATPDTATGLDDDPTVINHLMRELWAEVENGTYLGYTATPFANIFMDPNSGRSGELQELYPKDFIHVMPTPENYFGAERIFGLDGDGSGRLLPDVVRAIPQTEQPTVAPKVGDPSVTRSLADAIRWFIVASAIRRVRGQREKHSTMLIHTTPRVAPHFAMRDAVDKFLQPLLHQAREADVESFREVFHAERDRAAELYTGDSSAPSWQAVSDEIPNVLRKIHVSVDNGQADPSERLSYTDGPQTVIVIGGGTLSRGLTLEGLFVSFFCRSSNTYDTLLQMGRWFGYRIGYEDLQRVWMSPGLDDDYRFLATIEAEVRQEIRRMAGAGQTPEQIGVRVRLHPGRLQVTSPAKMKHVNVAQADFEGFRLQTTRFELSTPEIHDDNVQVVGSLRESIAAYRSPNDSSLYENVPVDDLASFFNSFSVHRLYQQNFRDAFKWSTEILPLKSWNVVIPSLNDAFELVTRTPMKKLGLNDDGTPFLDIRALMSAGDILEDLRRSGQASERVKRAKTNDDQMATRRDRAVLDGRGLLMLYPINRASKATASVDPRRESVRMDMDEALRQHAPALLEQRDAPLMGVAVISPQDTENRLAYKGTSVAVTPVFTDDEETVEEPPIDTEGDFRGVAL